MWFDARAMLAQIEADPPATSATSATRRSEPLRHVANVAGVAAPCVMAEGAHSRHDVADVADVAAPHRPKLKTACPARADGLDPDAAALLGHIHAHGPTTYGAASLALGWGVTRAWQAEAKLRAAGLVNMGPLGHASVKEKIR